MVKKIHFHIFTTQQKISLTKFPIAPTGDKALPLNVISKSMNFPFARKEDFWGKLTSISIHLSVVFQHANVFHKKSLEQIMRCKIILGANCTQISHMPQKGTFLGKLYSDIFSAARMYYR